MKILIARGFRFSAIAILTVALGQVAQGANTVHTTTPAAGTTTGNWSTTTWAGGVPGSSAGDIATSSGPNGSNSTLTLDTNVTIGSLLVASAGTTTANWTIASDGTHVLTMDGTGMTQANNPGGAYAAGVAIIASRAGGTLTVAPDIVLATSLDIGGTSPQTPSGVTINGNITASTTAAITFLGQGSGLQSNITSVLTVNGNVGLSGSNISISNLRAANTGTAGTVVINGALGSSVATVTQNSVASMTLSGADTYTGATTITSGTLQVKNGSAIPDTSAVTLANTAGATLALANDETVGSLAGGGTTGGNVTLGSTTLTVGGDGTSTSYAGVISGTGGLTKIGNGTQTLTGANTYTGVTSVTGGKLALGVANSINSASNIRLTGATLFSGGLADTVGTLTINSGVSIFDLGAAGSSTTFSFANSSALTWTGSLKIYNWTSGTDHVFFGSGATGLAGSQLSDISLYSDSGSTYLGTASLNSFGEIMAVSVPEPQEWSLLAAALLGAIIMGRRRSMRS